MVKGCMFSALKIILMVPAGSPHVSVHPCAGSAGSAQVLILFMSMSAPTRLSSMPVTPSPATEQIVRRAASLMPQSRFLNEFVDTPAEI